MRRRELRPPVVDQGQRRRAVADALEQEEAVPLWRRREARPFHGQREKLLRAPDLAARPELAREERRATRVDPIITLRYE